MRGRDSRFDVIVVGAGASGSWAAKLLAESGFSVLLLEAGPAMGAGQDPTGHGAAEPRARGDIHSRQPVQANCYAFNESTRHLFVDDLDCPYEVTDGTRFTWIRMRQQGGRTLLWNRVVLRMSQRQFKAASIDGYGLDWPIQYEDILPYYDEAERYLAVSGLPEGFINTETTFASTLRHGHIFTSFKRADWAHTSFFPIVLLFIGR